MRSTSSSKRAKRGRWLIAGGVVAGLALAACGSDDTSDSRPAPSTTTAAAATTTAAGGGAATTKAVAGSTPARTGSSR